MEASESGMERERPETEAAEAEAERPSGGMAFEAAPGVEVSRTGELVAAVPVPVGAAAPTTTTTATAGTMEAAEDQLADDDPPLLLPFGRPFLPFARPILPFVRPIAPLVRPIVPLVRPIPYAYPYTLPYTKVVPVPTYVVPQYYPAAYGGYPVYPVTYGYGYPYFVW